MPVDTTKKFTGFVVDVFENPKYACDKNGEYLNQFELDYKNFDILLRIYFGSNRGTLRDYIANLQAFDLIKINGSKSVIFSRKNYEMYLELIKRKKQLEGDL